MAVLDYIRDPAEIYRQSFATVRAETDLSRFSSDEAEIAVRVVHACGMPEIVSALYFGGEPIARTRGAIGAGRPVFCDVEMVRAAVIRRFLPDGADVVCHVGDAKVASLAKELATTRSAAAVSLWRDRLDGAVVIIGNAPTALFALLEAIDDGAPKPAAIFAFPVGFVGAAESKEALIARPRDVPFVTLRGRQGGSAIAAAAFNAVFAGARTE